MNEVNYAIGITLESHSNTGNSSIVRNANHSEVGITEEELNGVGNSSFVNDSNFINFSIKMEEANGTENASFINDVNYTRTDLEIENRYFESEVIDYFNGNNLGSLLSHDAPPPSIRDGILSKIRKISLVINHCDHPLDWIANFTSGFENIIDNVFIFTKCDQEISGALQGAQIIKLPNVGRCDHAYAHWLNNYFPTEPNATFATDHIVVFMKDTDYQVGEGSERKFGDMLSLAVLNGLGCMKLGWIPSVIYRYDVLRQMIVELPSYARTPGEKGHAVVVPFHNETFPNLGDWIDKLQISSIISTQNLVSVCCGAFFAVTNAQIAKQPKTVWKAIEESLSRGDNLVEGHYAERLWSCLLSKPLNNETASAIWEKNPAHEFDYWPLRGMITL